MPLELPQLVERLLHDRVDLRSPVVSVAAPRCRAALLFALVTESGRFEDRLRRSVKIRGQHFAFREGLLGDRRIVVGRSGSGQKNASEATQAIIDGHRPSLFISAGFAGGLAPTLQPFDIFVASEAKNSNGESIRLLDDDLAHEAQSSAAGFTVGRLLTFDRIIGRPEEKRELHESTGCDAVDMENFATAEVCRRNGVPFLSLRVIYDGANDAIPDYAENLLRQRTEPARWGAALGALWREPSRLKSLWQMKEKSLEASNRLAAAIEKIAATS